MISSFDDLVGESMIRFLWALGLLTVCATRQEKQSEGAGIKFE